MLAALRETKFVTRYEPPADIKKLQELTGSFAINRDVREFKLSDSAVSVVSNLLRKDEVGVIEATIPDGDTFPLHEHDVYEWLIPYKGTMRVVMEDNVLMVGPDRDLTYIFLQPGEAHEVSAVGDVGLIGITVPADEGYPGVGL